MISLCARCIYNKKNTTQQNKYGSSTPHSYQLSTPTNLWLSKNLFTRPNYQIPSQLINFYFVFVDSKLVLFLLIIKHELSSYFSFRRDRLACFFFCIQTLLLEPLILMIRNKEQYIYISVGETEHSLTIRCVAFQKDFFFWILVKRIISDHITKQFTACPSNIDFMSDSFFNYNVLKK